MKAYARTKPAPDPIRDRLVAEHVEMARRIALKVARRVPEWLGPDDLVAAAMVGLSEAALRYDRNRGEPFVAFAERRIRGAVLDELRKGDLMPRRVRNTARKVGAVQRKLEQQHGRPAEDEEIAEELGVSVNEYRDELEMLTHVRVVELGAEAEASVANEGSPAAIAERNELIQHLRLALDHLPERDARILALYYLEDFTYSEIGEVLGVTESRVCQLHARALSRLRAELSSDEGEEG